ISVIGITDAYYQAYFRDNFKNRVTHRIFIDDDAITEELLTQMTARYVNSAFIAREEVLKWFDEGADPARVPWQFNGPGYTWPHVNLGDRECSLYPFTRRSIGHLYNGLNEKSLRYFTRAIKDQFQALCDSHLGLDRFPRLESLGQTSYVITDGKTRTQFDRLPIPPEAVSYLNAILVLWGEGTLEVQRVSNDTLISGISVNFFKELRYDYFDSLLQSGSVDTQEIALNSVRNAPIMASASARPTDSIVKEHRDQNRLAKKLKALEEWRR
ncbi:hypothetical protein, partial [Methylacidiphilum caldifontis]|uniref:hypothetical protein n=1 Tax=Methylacidiphilum caldifontis TaxID=2795386 RepID=UPI00141B8A7C